MNWFIKFLGGYTKDDMERQSLIADGWRTRAIAAETTVELFKDIVHRERERSDRIEKDIRSGKEFQKETISPPEMKPVGTSVSSWPRIRRELERQNRVSNNGVPSKEEVEREMS